MHQSKHFYKKADHFEKNSFELKLLYPCKLLGYYVADP